MITIDDIRGLKNEVISRKANADQIRSNLAFEFQKQINAMPYDCFLKSGIHNFLTTLRIYERK